MESLSHLSHHDMERVWPKKRAEQRIERGADLRNDEFNEGIQCDVCLTINFRGPRYKCMICIDYDMCKICYEVNATSLDHLNTHRMENKITKNMRRELGDKWEIPRPEIELVKKLGDGNFGEVFYGEWKHMEIVVKILKKGIMSTDEFLQEAAIVRKLQHANLVQLFAVCSRDEPFYFIQEYMSNGCLLNYLRIHKGKTLQLNDLIFISHQIAVGMKYLEASKYIHGDLAARNIMIGKRNFTKICDFGLARAIATKEYCHIKWTAPEDILYKQSSTKADVWSYGIVLMEIFTYGEDPYPDMSNNEVLEKIKNGYRMERPENTPTKFYNLMKKCWNYDPHKRPTFESMVNLEFMENAHRS